MRGQENENIDPFAASAIAGRDLRVGSRADADIQMQACHGVDALYGLALWY